MGSVDMVVNREAKDTQEFVCRENDGYVVTSLKCLMDSGLDTGVVG